MAGSGVLSAHHNAGGRERGEKEGEERRRGRGGSGVPSASPRGRREEGAEKGKPPMQGGSGVPSASLHAAARRGRRRERERGEEECGGLAAGSPVCPRTQMRCSNQQLFEPGGSGYE